jgi:hypothetical protein
MDSSTLIVVIQSLMGAVVATMGFIIKMVFVEMNKNEDRINELEKDVSGLRERSKSIFQRLDSIEQKLDRLLAKEV